MKEEQYRQTSFTTVVKKPEECTADEIEIFVKFLIAGERVDGRNLKQTVMARGSRLAFARDGELFVGIAGAKKPSRHYVMNVFTKAGVASDAVNYGLEIGWGYTLPEYRRRGLSGLLVRKLFDEVSDRNIFGTIAIGNEPMIRIVTGLGFEKFGHAFEGRADPVQLFTWRTNTDEKYADGWIVKIRAAASRFAS